MPFIVHIDDARREFPQYRFISALTPSEQKAAFHVQDENNNDLCLKIISPNFETDRVRREIVALQQINHPNLSRLVEYTFSSKQGGQQKHFIVEEFVHGTDLSSKLGSPWSLTEAASFFRLICLGLDQLRQLELVHRDLKPTNIRVRSEGTPVIIDFGLVRHLSLPDLTRTVEGAEIGTPKYFAPEQCRGTKYDIDHRTDLFTTGVLLFEAITGEHPFLSPGMTLQSLYESICESEDWRENSQWHKLPEQWKLISEKLLRKERSDRPYSAEQVATYLDKLGNII